MMMANQLRESRLGWLAAIGGVAFFIAAAAAEWCTPAETKAPCPQLSPLPTVGGP